MSQWVALLRGVNVGSANRLPMADLRMAMLQRGFEAPETLLQSGNLLFRLAATNPADVSARLSLLLLQEFDISTTAVVRSTDQWRSVIRRNPMPDQAALDPSRLLVHFFNTKPAVPEVAPPDLAVVSGEELYVWHPNGQSASPLFRDRAWLRATSEGTARNWNTILKIAAKLH